MSSSTEIFEQSVDELVGGSIWEADDDDYQEEEDEEEEEDVN